MLCISASSIPFHSQTRKTSCAFTAMADAAPSTVRRISTVRSRFGLQPNVPLEEGHQDLEHQDLLWSRIRLAMREPFAEFFGTFIMVLFGDGSVAQVSLCCPLNHLQPQLTVALPIYRCCFLLDRKLLQVKMEAASTNRFLGGKLRLRQSSV